MPSRKPQPGDFNQYNILGNKPTGVPKTGGGIPLNKMKGNLPPMGGNMKPNNRMPPMGGLPQMGQNPPMNPNMSQGGMGSLPKGPYNVPQMGSNQPMSSIPPMGSIPPPMGNIPPPMGNIPQMGQIPTNMGQQPKMPYPPQSEKKE